MNAPRSPYRVIDPGPQGRVIVAAPPATRLSIPLLVEVPWFRGAHMEHEDYWIESGSDVARDDPVVSVTVQQKAEWPHWKLGGVNQPPTVMVSVQRGDLAGLYGVRVDLGRPLSLPSSLVEALKLRPDLEVTVVG